jgi:hypothetical protein
MIQRKEHGRRQRRSFKKIENVERLGYVKTHLN